MLLRRISLHLCQVLTTWFSLISSTVSKQSWKLQFHFQLCKNQKLQGLNLVSKDCMNVSCLPSKVLLVLWSLCLCMHYHEQEQVSVIPGLQDYLRTLNYYILTQSPQNFLEEQASNANYFLDTKKALCDLLLMSYLPGIIPAYCLYHPLRWLQLDLQSMP